MSGEMVEIDRGTLSNLYGHARTLAEMDDVQVYSGQLKALGRAEELLGRDGPYRRD